MVLTPAPYRHELDNTIHATFLYTTHAYTPSRCSCQRCKKDNQCPKLFSDNNRSWERTRRAPRPQPDGGDAHRAMLPDHATKSIAKKSKKEYYRLSSTCGAPRNQRSARGRTRLTTVTSISCRSFYRQLLQLYLFSPLKLVLVGLLSRIMCCSDYLNLF